MQVAMFQWRADHDSVWEVDLELSSVWLRCVLAKNQSRRPKRLLDVKIQVDAHVFATCWCIFLLPITYLGS